jgi:hypothetical protein
MGPASAVLRRLIWERCNCPCGSAFDTEAQGALGEEHKGRSIRGHPVCNAAATNADEEEVADTALNEIRKPVLDTFATCWVDRGQDGRRRRQTDQREDGVFGWSFNDFVGLRLGGGPQAGDGALRIRPARDRDPSDRDPSDRDPRVSLPQRSRRRTARDTTDNGSTATKTQGSFGFGSVPGLIFAIDGGNVQIDYHVGQVPGVDQVLAISGAEDFAGEPVWTLGNFKRDQAPTGGPFSSAP